MAKKLYSRMKDKNILLILDNIWESLELDKTIGIPCGADRGRNKLLFTTRNLDVLEKMGSTNNYGMNILNEEEAWALFTKMVIFPDLMVLILRNIISRKIWDNQIPTSSFQNLKQLILWRCTKMKYVFSYTITKNLQQLQYLEMKDCIVLEEVVATEGVEAAASFVFPQVTLMKLQNLPELATFYHGMHTSEWSMLKELVVEDCDKFKMFTSEPNSLCLDQKV
ncbi:uncharacterized protein LOC123196558 [Mangifera indica]|uniref:uncharacterized protein LOC123196558 n=1 Tax=Mangifera indica TaxID=29780 RepID=UPI001CFA96A8|nr:uncharacterized protein LOC123196558 [Mangifera indica]